MGQTKLYQMIYKYFSEIYNEDSISLIEAYYFDSCHYCDDNQNIISLSKQSLKEIKSNHWISKRKDFIFINSTNSTFKEPFISWFDIPDWYILDYSFGTLGLISSQKFNFNLPKFITILIDFEYLGDESLDYWLEYLIPNDDSIIPMINRSFNLLNNKQENIIAKCLAFDITSKSFKIEQLLEIENENCRDYWVYYFNLNS